MRWKLAIVVVAAGLPALAGAEPDEPPRDEAATAETARPGRVLIERLGAVERFLDGEDAEAEEVRRRECLRLDRRCLRYLRRSPDMARRAIPDNPEYWSIYREVLRAAPLSKTVEEVETSPSSSGLIDAANFHGMHELLVHGELVPARVHEHVMAHRRLLAEAEFMIDKMIVIATVNITTTEINVLMAQLGGSVTAGQGRLLDDLLRPMTLPERSLRRAFEGERRFLLARADEQRDHPAWNETALSDVERMYDYIVERSEAPWADYWRNGMDLLAELPDFPSPEVVPAYEGYGNNLRYLDAFLEVLRALREVYSGRVTPGVPASPPPALWHWQWREASQTLCLEPGYVHVSLGQPETICMEYLAEAFGTP